MHPVALQYTTMKNESNCMTATLRSALLKYVENTKNGSLPTKKVQDMPESDLLEALRHFDSGTDFAYVIDVAQLQLYGQYNMAEALGYEPEALTLGGLIEALHPDERQRLHKLSRRMLEFVRRYRVEPVFSLGHRIRKADGNYVRVLRRVYPLHIDERHQVQLYVCLCTDITAHVTTDKITLDVTLPPAAPCTRAEALAYFRDILSEKPVKFTPQELAVIRVWVETDSAKLAAGRLGITVRTAETHLKNARRKLGVRRTLDLVLYAKEHGLV
jgi:PAS domain S-box-containing protein